ncbi:MAG TPA: hypothetical protein VGO67_07670 [Verrucomicrobiae bacterium]|jgi:hypothetical protein
MKPLANSKGVLMEEPEYFGPQSFSVEVIAQFPEKAAELTENSGILHIQMGLLASAARKAIEVGDTVFLKRVFRFINDILARERLHPDVEDAVADSFLTLTEFEQSEAGRNAWNLLPEKLRRLISN